jgi:hypothetical protein
MKHMGWGRYRTESYPSGNRSTFGLPNEIVRYAFEVTTAMAGKTMDPIANQLGAAPEDSAAIVNFGAVLFTVPGGRLDVGALVVINGTGNTGDAISLQYVLATIASPLPALDGSVKADVIDPTDDGILGSQIDFSDVIIPAGGGILALQAIIPANVVIDTTLVVSLSVGVIWDPSTFTDPPG